MGWTNPPQGAGAEIAASSIDRVRYAEMGFGVGAEPVDEVVLVVYPVLLGRGKRCFSDSADPRELALVSSQAMPSGVLINTYRHVGPVRT